MSDQVVSYIRTYAPILAGGIVSWLISVGIDVGEEGNVGLTIFLSGLLMGLWYFIGRQLEKRWPAIGRWMLGSSRQPEYTEPQAER